MLDALKRYVKRNQIKAAQERHRALANFQAAVRKGDTRAQHEAEKRLQDATARALRLGA